VGLYSVIAYSVAGRGNEFAIRLALGATAQGIMRVVIREGAIVATLGLALGIVVAMAGVRVIGSMLYETSASDPAVYLGATAALLMVALVAVAVPARRAGRVDPAMVLRES
jgi:putative ABC transport system permease protein